MGSSRKEDALGGPEPEFCRGGAFARHRSGFYASPPDGPLSLTLLRRTKMNKVEAPPLPLRLPLPNP